MTYGLPVVALGQSRYRDFFFNAGRFSASVAPMQTGRLFCIAFAVLAVALVWLPKTAAATPEGGSVVVWPTVIDPKKVPADSSSERDLPSDPELVHEATTLDLTLREAIQDLGFQLKLSDHGFSKKKTRDIDLIERQLEAETWLVSPRLEHLSGGTYLIRLAVVSPHSSEVRVRVERVTKENVAARSLVMFRDLLTSRADAKAPPAASRNLATTVPIVSPREPRSSGRAVLAINGALFGAYNAYSVQRASGSNDPRILYPLLAIGTGIGLGSALLAAEEWDVTVGGAWFLAAGAWWGAGAGIMLANGHHVKPLTDRYAWGAGAGLAGLTLATVALSRVEITEGGAALAHSGAAVGTLTGGLVEWMVRGSVESTPSLGGAYGAASGLIAAGVAATQLKVTPSRVLLVDLGIGLGTLAGAAIASPLVFNDLNEVKNRAFVAAMMSGAIAGGVTSWFLTKNLSSTAAWIERGKSWPQPTLGIIGSTETRTGPVPAYGIGVHGQL